MGEFPGSVITNVAPSPSVLSTVSVPPCPCVTMSYESDRPNPVPDPVGFVVKKGSDLNYLISTIRPVATMVRVWACARTR